MTFLMLIYSSQCFGLDVIKNATKKVPNEFISKWIGDFMLESSNSGKDLFTFTESHVDNLMQQLSNGELRTQVVKWQVVCCSIHQAFKVRFREIFIVCSVTGNRDFRSVRLKM